MKYSSLLVALIAISLTACGNKPVETTPFVAPAASAPAASLPAGHPAIGSAMMPQNTVDPANAMQAAALPPLSQKAQVLSTIDASQYTYLEVKQDNNTLWLATTATNAKKGDTIQFDEGTVMTNFNSKILNRTFPSITFVGRVVVTK